jgi:hypothetical protein
MRPNHGHHRSRTLRVTLNRRRFLLRLTGDTGSERSGTATEATEASEASGATRDSEAPTSSLRGVQICTGGRGREEAGQVRWGKVDKAADTPVWPQLKPPLTPVESAQTHNRLPNLTPIKVPLERSTEANANKPGLPIRF